MFILSAQSHSRRVDNNFFIYNENNTHQLEVTEDFSFFISFWAHVERVFVLVTLDRRPSVRRSTIGSTSSKLKSFEPNVVHKSLNKIHHSYSKNKYIHLNIY